MMKRQVLAVAAVATILVGGALAAVPAATAETIGALAVEPASGRADTGVVYLVASENCPAPTTNVIVRISGANFPEGSNAVGNNDIGLFKPSVSGKGLLIPLGGRWDVIAATNGATKPLDGLAELTLQCTNELVTEIYGELSGQIRFTAGDGGLFRYEQAGGPALESGIIRALPSESPEPYIYQPDATSTGAAPAAPAAPMVGAAPSGESADASDSGAQGDPDVVPESGPGDGQAPPDGPQDRGQGASADSSGTDRSDLASSGAGESDPARTPLLLGTGVLIAATLGGSVIYLRQRHLPGK